MNNSILNLEKAILDSVHHMNESQQADVLTYMNQLIQFTANTKEKYRREAMKQIREALTKI